MHSACTEQSCLARKLAKQFTVDVHSHVACTAATCTWNYSPPPEPGADVSMAVRLGDLLTFVADFEMPEFLTAHDDYVCQACGDLVQKNIRVQPRGRALLLHRKFQSKIMVTNKHFKLKPMPDNAARPVLQERGGRERALPHGHSNNVASSF